MAFEKLLLEIFAGATIDIGLEVFMDGQVPDLTGWEAKSHWKKNPDSTLVDVLFSTANGSIAELNETGIVRLLKNNVESADIPPGKYYFDVALKSPTGVVGYYAWGEITILKSVTKW